MTRHRWQISHCRPNVCGCRRRLRLPVEGFLVPRIACRSGRALLFPEDEAYLGQTLGLSQFHDSRQLLEHGLVVEPVPALGPLRLPDQTHDGVVVNRLARERAVTNQFANAVSFCGNPQSGIVFVPVHAIVLNHSYPGIDPVVNCARSGNAVGGGANDASRQRPIPEGRADIAGRHHTGRCGRKNHHRSQDAKNACDLPLRSSANVSDAQPQSRSDLLDQREPIPTSVLSVTRPSSTAPPARDVLHFTKCKMQCRECQQLLVSFFLKKLARLYRRPGGHACQGTGSLLPRPYKSLWQPVLPAAAPARAGDCPVPAPIHGLFQNRPGPMADRTFDETLYTKSQFTGLISVFDHDPYQED